jgi:hypothetical protein
MVEIPRRPGLAREAFTHRGALPWGEPVRGVEDLDRHGATDGRIMRAIHDSGRPPADLVEHDIAPDLLLRRRHDRRALFESRIGI